MLMQLETLKRVLTKVFHLEICSYGKRMALNSSVISSAITKVSGLTY